MYPRKRNLKFEKKIGFISDIGVFEQRTLNKLNTIRNRIEHDYSVPDIEDLDIYYDLCHAYILALEAAITVLYMERTGFFC